MNSYMPRLAFIGSTGRTATTFIAAVLNKLPGVLACHEGYPGSNKDQAPLIPLINLENRQAYLNPAAADDIVKSKRNIDLIKRLSPGDNFGLFIDVAYYNSMLAIALLKAHAQAKFIGIIRDCESFVRSATAMQGEDPLPVGWANSKKTLSPREKFISMGRIAPRPHTIEKGRWNDMSAIEKNIWLWRETNQVLIDASRAFPDRVALMRFELINIDKGTVFFSRIADHLGIDQDDMKQAVFARDEKFQNKKPQGYQVAEARDWSALERQYLKDSVENIEHWLSDV